jgi:hypothetical protein
MSESFQSGECCNYWSHETEEIIFRPFGAPVLVCGGLQRLDSFPVAARGRHFSKDS